mmetsp:Transcript_17372/g.29139  ORF Transcript_17372/g.29139 Transcript_17372/m.29139 type:complete len:194 (-) Transcript_17372:137-718(-)|eukprot:CAMPEP_0174977290 /NCGR_PEP_ID=MMETSP0004_2-20121128/13523_1 /TAXON_ID=420556 /ORGANISM="Ochromonas sp., Strain CCMP1393" /LENGTH=193 /DNA_ID=CAMNT_0016228449 /DNA_START=72 /DNA_END=653 /DNA_ORIENTATION=-
MCSVGECDLLVKELLSRDKKLRSLLKVDANGSDPTWNIRCRNCDMGGIEGRARAYITEKPNEIILCSNRLKDGQSVKEALTHESVHAYDYANQRCDFFSCDGLAYTEVRAAREAECSNRYMHTLPFVGDWFKENCIKGRATASTSNLFPKNARHCVEKVYSKAVLDDHPQLEATTTAAATTGTTVDTVPSNCG